VSELPLRTRESSVGPIGMTTDQKRWSLCIDCLPKMRDSKELTRWDVNNHSIAVMKSRVQREDCIPWRNPFYGDERFCEGCMYALEHELLKQEAME
jgi:hypothetical protein